MEPIQLKCELQERKSKASGNTYKAIVIQLDEQYEKIVFLDYAEQRLVDLQYKTK